MRPMCRITAMHLGKDNLARAVTIKTATVISDRPFAKICPLSKEDQSKAPRPQRGEDQQEERTLEERVLLKCIQGSWPL